MAVLTAAGCTSDISSSDTTTSGFRVNVQAIAPQQTDQFQIDIKTCSGTPVTSATAKLLPIKLPGGLSIAEGVLDQDSKHPAADHFFTLDAGCYRATATPQDAAGRRVDECNVAESSKLIVEDGRTTETMLVSQCRGAKRGGLDVISTLNRPPHVKELTFTPSKFVQCPREVEICALAVDPDNDPMRGEWSIRFGPTPVTQPTVVKNQSENGRLYQCIRFEPGAGEWTLQFKAWDRLNYGGQKMDFEEYYTKIGQPKESNDFLRFPLYGGGQCDEPDVGVDTGQPDTGLPDTEVPDTEVPDTEVPDTEMPDTEVPDTELPDTEVPDTDMPDTDMPDTEMPDTEMPDTEMPDADVGLGCTRTRGYWGNWHDGATPPVQDVDWPAPEDESNPICNTTWLAAINPSPGQNSNWEILAPQYIAAKLNVAAGAFANQTVQNALTQAEMLLNANNCPTITDPSWETYKDILDEFNNGELGPPKCDEPS